MGLTDDAFWDDYWRNLRIPAEIDTNFAFERCLAEAFSDILGENHNLDIFEIGCAPGKWLAYFHKNYGYRVAGIENSDVGYQKTVANFAAQQIQGKIYQADFLTFTPPERYDVVLSLGVLEHFENPYPILERHLAFLKPDGKLIIGLPNFKGANYLIQKRLDKTLLAKHNLKIMTPYFYHRAAREFGLKCTLFRYVSGFCPSLFFYPSRHSPDKLSLSMRIILKTAKWLRETNWLDNLNAPFFSSYLLGILQRRSAYIWVAK